MSEVVSIRVQRLPHAAALPSYAHPGDAGADLVAAEDVLLQPGQRAAVATGLAIAIPDGYVGLVHPRSGLALRHGLGVANSPGTIDSGFRGELKVLLINTDPEEPIRLQRGDRIAQLVIQPVIRAEFVEAESLDDSARAGGGFGSTGGWTHHGHDAATGEPTGAEIASGPGHRPAGG